MQQYDPTSYVAFSQKRRTRLKNKQCQVQHKHSELRKPAGESEFLEQPKDNSSCWLTVSCSAEADKPCAKVLDAAHTRSQRTATGAAQGRTAAG